MWKIRLLCHGYAACLSGPVTLAVRVVAHKRDLAIPQGMNFREKRKTSVSSVWKKADPSSLIPLWWEQHLTMFWALTLTREGSANGDVWSSTLLWSTLLFLCYPVFYLFFCTNDVTVTNVWRVINKQEMPHNKKQMETKMIRGSELYFLSIKLQASLRPLELMVHYPSNDSV